MAELSKRVFKDLVGQFTKRELLEIADDIGHECVGKGLETVVREVYDACVSLLSDPDDSLSDVSDLTFEFLTCAELIDKDGYPVQDETEEEVQEEKYPECFSLADPKDPSCKICKVFDACMKMRISKRPQCYGKLYDQHAPECQLCIEASGCMKLVRNI